MLLFICYSIKASVICIILIDYNWKIIDIYTFELKHNCEVHTKHEEGVDLHN